MIYFFDAKLGLPYEPHRNRFLFQFLVENYHYGGLNRNLDVEDFAVFPRLQDNFV